MPSPSETPPPCPGRACRLCETPVPNDTERCPACGLHQAADVPQDSRWQLIGGMIVVYAVVALLVLVTK